MGSHINDKGLFQSDKYPDCPAGKVPLSVKDPTAQDLLWEYAQRRRSVDAEFSDDLETSLRNAGYEHKPLKVFAVVDDDGRHWAVASDGPEAIRLVAEAIGGDEPAKDETRSDPIVCEVADDTELPMLSERMTARAWVALGDKGLIGSTAL